MKVFIDTSGFTALYRHGDRDHKEAALIWEDLLKNRTLLYTSNYVIAETMTLLRRRISHRSSVEFGELLFASSQIQIIRPNAQQDTEALSLFKKFDDQNFSFFDCSSFAIMRDIGIRQALAFDDDFTIAGFERLCANP